MSKGPLPFSFRFPYNKVSGSRLFLSFYLCKLSSLRTPMAQSETFGHPIDTIKPKPKDLLPYLPLSAPSSTGYLRQVKVYTFTVSFFCIYYVLNVPCVPFENYSGLLI